MNKTLVAHACLFLFNSIAAAAPLRDDPLKVPAAVSPDGKIVCMVTAKKEIVEVREIADGKPGNLVHTITTPATVRALAVTQDGKQLLTCHENGLCCKWDLLKGKEEARIEKGPAGVVDITLTGDGRHAYLVEQSAACDWDLQENKLTTLRMPDGVRCVAISRDGTKAAVCVEKQCLRTIDLATGKTISEDNNKTPTMALTFSPDGASLAVRRHTGHVLIFNPARLDAEPKTMTAYCANAGARCFPLGYSPDGRFLWSVFANHTVVWEVQTGSVLFASQAGQVAWCGFARDGRQLALRTKESLLIIDIFARAEGSKDLTEEEVWAHLGSLEASKSRSALAWLLADPKIALEQMKKRLRPVQVVDAKTVGDLIQGLESEDYGTRERSFEGLTRLGDNALPEIRKHLTRKLGVDTRRRLERLVQALEVDHAKSNQFLQALRAMYVLEQINTSESRAILKDLAGGGNSRLTTAAKESCQRLRIP